MTKTSKTVIFFGNERLATGVTTSAPTLRALVAAGYQVAAVVSNHEAARSRRPRPLEIQAVAEELQIPLLLPDQPSDILDQLKGYQAEVGILVAYGKIVPQSVIDVFPAGIVNIHPSLLPRHRGPTPLESVILDGSQHSGVSIMNLSAKMDAGPVYSQTSVELSGQASKQQLADRFLEVGGQMLLEVLPSILNGQLQPTEQDDSQASYDRLITKADGLIDWHKSAVQLEREVRAFAGWPGSRTVLGGLDVTITAAQVVERQLKPGQVLVDNKQLLVGTDQNSLAIMRLTPAGKKDMDVAAFLAGNRSL
jgi:methionyl-tRNA formyltransferase